MSGIKDDQQRTLPGFTMITCRRGRRGRAPCDVAGCGKDHSKLCDFQLRGAKAGETCDAKLCEIHATPVGDGRDYCPAHVRAKGTAE